MPSTNRDLRRELRALMKRDLLMPAVIAYEVNVSVAAVEEYLRGAPKSAQFMSQLAQFVENYTDSWQMVEIADNATRAGMALRFLSNIRLLINEVESAASPVRRGELRDVLVGQIAAACRVVELMGADAGQSPEQFAAMIRKTLRAGETMLIKRGGRAGD